MNQLTGDLRDAEKTLTALQEQRAQLDTEERTLKQQIDELTASWERVQHVQRDISTQQEEVTAEQRKQQQEHDEAADIVTSADARAEEATNELEKLRAVDCAAAVKQATEAVTHAEQVNTASHRNVLIAAEEAEETAVTVQQLRGQYRRAAAAASAPQNLTPATT